MCFKIYTSWLFWMLFCHKTMSNSLGTKLLWASDVSGQGHSCGQRGPPADAVQRLELAFETVQVPHKHALQMRLEPGVATARGPVRGRAVCM